MIPCKSSLQLSDNTIVTIRGCQIGAFQRLLDGIECCYVAFVMSVVMPICRFYTYHVSKQLFRILIRVRTRAELPFVRHWLNPFMLMCCCDGFEFLTFLLNRQIPQEATTYSS